MPNSELEVGDVVRWNTSGHHSEIAKERVMIFGDVPLLVKNITNINCINICHLDGSRLYDKESGIGGWRYWGDVLKKDPFLTAIKKRRK